MTKNTMKNKLSLVVLSCICYVCCLLTWFLPGSYSYYYLEGQVTKLWETSLYAFFPASALLPLIPAGTSLWCLARKHIPKGSLWTALLSSLLLGLYLGYIGAIRLPGFGGETFIWLQTLPLPLTLAGAFCLLLSFRKETKIFQK